MASFVFAKAFANAGAVATMTGFASTALVYVGKKAFALEKEGPVAQSPKTVVPRQRKLGLSIAPQFDGLNCFETMVSK
ncbi:hypothetical protein MPTK1_1g09120 [Marchantia polymorpha subsp. ruderalis]|uniref:Uncharacterized protein n=1 Tax=Marchantia polymorpha subsp. ruderalis TaxID=1480154 RepID=A0A176VPY7_MARPO|nr:hypothetical protein AXG93_2318s1190 [Marchantia polymorpha subsp. ruderalis]